MGLEKLDEKDLVRYQPHSQFRNEREFIFKHDLIRDVAYEMLPRAERRRLHGLIADWMASTAGDMIEHYFDALAHHTLNAGQDERALGYLMKAAEQAGQVAAHRQEASLLAGAVDLAERLLHSALVGELRARRRHK